VVLGPAYAALSEKTARKTLENFMSEPGKTRALFKALDHEPVVPINTACE